MLSIHVGQAGIQIGNACWERYTIEHGINPDGTRKPEVEPCSDEDYLMTFFEPNSRGEYVPRTLLVDLEPGPIGTKFVFPT